MNEINQDQPVTWEIVDAVIEEIEGIQARLNALERHLASTVSAGYLRRPPEETKLKWIPPLCP